MDIQVKIAIGLMILIVVIGIGSATYQECREIMCDGHMASKELKGKDTDKGVLIPWNKKMSDNLIGFHKHGIKFIGY